MSFSSRFLSPEFLCYFALLLWAHWRTVQEVYDSGLSASTATSQPVSSPDW